MFQSAILGSNGSITEHVRQAKALFVAPPASGPHNFLNSIFPHLHQFTSLQVAHDAAEVGSVIYLADGEYDETLAITKSSLSFLALSQGVYPRAIIKPAAADALCLSVAVGVRKVAFVGVGFEPNTANAAKTGVRVYGSDIDFVDCKFAGDGGMAVQIGGGVDDAAARVKIFDSEFEWADRHLMFKVASGTGNLNTQIEVRGCRFHNATTRSIGRLDAASVTGSFFSDCRFFQNEDGSVPTKYLELDGAAEKNSFQSLRFDTANATGALMLVAAAAKWVDCWTEAGVSAAHPT